jgi:hypothetical protein
MLPLAIVLALTTPLESSEIAPAGLRLAERYDSMDVEHHWLPGRRVDWRTGDPDSGKPGKTHCSAFVAAACERLGIYILRPPQHGQVDLANAQQDWLLKEGKTQGWKPVNSPYEAQRLANEGKIVVAVYADPTPNKPGHVALVRPSDKSETLIQHEGPQIIQAGARNASSTSLKEGFRHHPGAWRSANDYRVMFFAHEF